MKGKLIILILIVSFMLTVSALADTVYYGTMMVDNCEEWVSLRDGPGTGCGRLAKVPLYSIVTDCEKSEWTGDFIYCNYDGQWGYILAQYLVPWADPEPEEEKNTFYETLEHQPREHTIRLVVRVGRHAV